LMCCKLAALTCAQLLGVSCGFTIGCLLLMLLQVTVQFLPLDNVLCMRQFLAHWKPQACILMVRGWPYSRKQRSSNSCSCSGQHVEYW
jgi:hypothetical protein